MNANAKIGSRTQTATRGLDSGARRVTRGAAPPAALALRQILVPLDFSDCSQRALQSAVALAKPFRSGLILLYVAENKPAGCELGACHLPALESDLRRLGRKELAKLQKRTVPPGLRCRALIRAGRSDTEIIDTAKSLHADLIVMATHSCNSQPGHLGSTTERVARAAPCPVLLVPVAEMCVPFFL